jgi:hypothetical protein
LKASASPKRLLLQIDFAENFLCQWQDEVQAAHYHQSQISVFTACCWDGDSSPSSHVVVSDTLKHDKSTVVANLIQLIPQLLLDRQCDELHVFSDGPSSQMKNCYIYAVLDSIRRYFNLNVLSWSFFAASHGKGPVDGIGGMVKRLVWQAIVSRQVVSVKNATEFVSALLTRQTSINVVLSSAESEKQALEKVNANQVFEKAQQLPQISQDHHWICNSTGTRRQRLNTLFTFVDKSENVTFDIIDIDPVEPAPLYHSGSIVKCTLYDRYNEISKNWLIISFYIFICIL